MAIIDLFKSKWSSDSMTPEDRQRIFWYLKRKTSYMAWNRQRTRFAIFLSILEKQIREQPIFEGEFGYPTEWEPSYVIALKAAASYEKGLARLSRGDRTVWLYNSLGELRDAMFAGNELYNEIVNGGHDLDPYKYQGKYLTELKSALTWYFEAIGDSGYVQPKMANRSASEVWHSERHKTLLSLTIPEPLPEIPPYTDITVRTGELVPAFGIYEPQVRDGCMNYLLQGEPARSYAPSPVRYDGSPVTWRLVWEDNRYEDGNVPEEEQHYFPNDPSTPPVLASPIASSVGSTVTANTGSEAPHSGRWAVLDDLNGMIHIQKGEVLPPYKGRNVVWVWSS